LFTPSQARVQQQLHLLKSICKKRFKKCIKLHFYPYYYFKIRFDGNNLTRVVFSVLISITFNSQKVTNKINHQKKKLTLVFNKERKVCGLGQATYCPRPLLKK
jgi:hypothetical protein